MKITIERTSDDGLTGQCWTFMCNAGWSYGDRVRILLESWHPVERGTRRQKWRKAGEGYMNRYCDNYSNLGWRKPAAEVPFPDDVIEEVKREVLARLDIIGPVDPPRGR